MGTTDVVTISASILAWVSIFVVFYFTYKTHQEKLAFWKVFIIFMIGIFSFSYNFNFKSTVISIPVLPLGVWFLMLWYRTRRSLWQNYHRFAWVGFFSAFIFAFTTLLTIPVQHVIYPADEISTYIADTDHVSILQTHPSAEERVLDHTKLTIYMRQMEQHPIHSVKWYDDAVMESQRGRTTERFPYQLTGVQPKWGSGKHAIIFVEADGKGLLITTPKHQYYFRSDEPLFKEDAHT
ncbi:hypothetical protein [Lentibacillus saliphilus]|uniref:hypothetical protein n=1 Tax=Lentibacillus saliphilus TaxID=2737028 RepID=UPI001C302BFE|nr:hypothetical protein [Lentibacillus saliphilus]